MAWSIPGHMPRLMMVVPRCDGQHLVVSYCTLAYQQVLGRPDPENLCLGG